jgi:hypothetical protein
LYLYVHPDIPIVLESRNFVEIGLIGEIFDPANPKRTNSEVVSELLNRAQCLRELTTAVKPLTGRYALIYIDGNDFVIFHDALGLREIYYCTEPNEVVCGSQPNLVASFSKPRLGVTQNRTIVDFYENDLKQVRSGRLWVGEDTYYQNTRKLLTNHLLDLGAMTVRRYWPDRRLENTEFRTAVKLTCTYLKGAIEAIMARHKVMIAVTAGVDSRSLLAASREVRDRIYYFINKEPNLSDHSPDIRIPRKIFKDLNIPFHIHKTDGPVDQEFRSIFLNNVFMATDSILPTIYNVYFKNHQDKVNLLGVGEIGRSYYGPAPRNISGYYLARNLKYKWSTYAALQCEKWLDEAQKVASTYNVDVMKMFLWEVLLGHWGVVGNSESDIAIEEFDPYDSHYVYELMLTVEPTREEFFEALFKEMWPELLAYPFNPPDTLRDWFSCSLMRIGVFPYIKRARYGFDHWRFRRFKSARPDRSAGSP